MSFEWLRAAERNSYSQFGEDGVIEAIFKVLRPANRWCFECGANDGIFFSNTRKLLRDGWDAILVERDQALYHRLYENTAAFGERARAVCEKVERLDPILEAFGAPRDIDLVSIDVDGQDYYLFNSLLRFEPRVVIVEYAPNIDGDFIPDLDGEGQAGLAAMRKLASGRFYTEVWRSWCNLVLVRQPLDRLLSLGPGGQLP